MENVIEKVSSIGFWIEGREIFATWRDIDNNISSMNKYELLDLFDALLHITHARLKQV